MATLTGDSTPLDEGLRASLLLQERHHTLDAVVRTVNKSVCQICFETDPAATVRLLCGDRCTAVICSTCLSQHVRITMRDTMPGILPRVRCPVCLRHLPKNRWAQHILSAEDVAMFEALCARACAFLSPCCHQDSYTHLPQLNEPQPSLTQTLDSTRAGHLNTLRGPLARFLAYHIQPRELVRVVEAAARYNNAENLDAVRQHIVDTLLGCIVDDERRASLLIAFHSIYKRVTTRCCSVSVCFNCKRKWDGHHEANPHAPCDQIELTQHDMLQCRSCRATIVKVEGCNVVTCMCGFSMNWANELHLRDDLLRGLIPIDVLDIELFRDWRHWCSAIKSCVLYGAQFVRSRWRMQHIARAIARYGALLRRMLQCFIWRRRFSALLPTLECHTRGAQQQFLLRRLQRSAPFRGAVRCFPRRMQWRMCLRSIKRRRYDEELFVGDELMLASGLFD